MALKPKQEVFCQEIAKGLTPTEAARAAGYASGSAHVTASRMMDMPPIVARVAELKTLVTARVVEQVAQAQSDVIERIAIDKAWVLGQLVENVETAKQAVPVTIDGVQVGIYEQNLAAANKALELIGKELGMFVERKEVRTGNLDLTDEQLDAALIAARALVAAQDPRAGEGNAGRRKTGSSRIGPTRSRLTSMRRAPSTANASSWPATSSGRRFAPAPKSRCTRPAAIPTGGAARCSTSPSRCGSPASPANPRATTRSASSTARSAPGTGMVPKDAIKDKDHAPRPRRCARHAHRAPRWRWRRAGRRDAHRLQVLRPGPREVAGPDPQLVWFDEEPPEDIYTEGLTRTNVAMGPVFLTFTPLLGMSEVVKRFLIDPGPGNARDHDDDRRRRALHRRAARRDHREPTPRTSAMRAPRASRRWAPAASSRSRKSS
jgi:phage terminase large subunit-like protein